MKDKETNAKGRYGLDCHNNVKRNKLHEQRTTTGIFSQRRGSLHSIAGGSFICSCWAMSDSAATIVNANRIT